MPEAHNQRFYSAEHVRASRGICSEQPIDPLCNRLNSPYSNYRFLHAFQHFSETSLTTRRPSRLRMCRGDTCTQLCHFCRRYARALGSHRPELPEAVEKPSEEVSGALCFSARTLETL